MHPHREVITRPQLTTAHDVAFELYCTYTLLDRNNDTHANLNLATEDKDLVCC